MNANQRRSQSSLRACNTAGGAVEVALAVPRCLKVRVLMQELRALGCCPVRTAGSHQVWRTPCGRHVTLVIKHLNADVTMPVMTDVRRALRREGLDQPPIRSNH